MDEGRKRVVLIAAAILAARKLAQYEGAYPVPATIMAIDEAIRRAATILGEIDRMAGEVTETPAQIAPERKKSPALYCGTLFGEALFKCLGGRTKYRCFAI